MWLSGLSVDTAGAQRICSNVSIAAFIGSGGQLLLPGGDYITAATMFVIGLVLGFAGTVQVADTP